MLSAVRRPHRNRSLLTPRSGGYPVTPDGRYFLVHGRLWRCTNPHLPPEQKRRHVQALMAARRGVRAARRQQDEAAIAAARMQVHAAKVALGERGAPWWGLEGSTFDRRQVENTPYSEWATELCLGADGRPSR